MGAKQRDQYSWVGKSPEFYVFTAEIDHKNNENNRYDHKQGVFSKTVPAMTKDAGKDPLSISHAKELFDAAKDAFENRLMCRLLLTKGTKSGTTKGGVTAAADGDLWQVTDFEGSLDGGFSLRIERVSHS
jgi:hypothetical protein